MSISSIHPNMINEAMNLKGSDTPEVGMVATMFCGSDRWPMVCTEVISKSRVRVAMMSDADYARAENSETSMKVFSDDMLYTNNYFEEIPGRKEVTLSNGEVVRPLKPRGRVYTLRKNKRWIEAGHDMWSTGAVHFGYAEEYRDPSF